MTIVAYRPAWNGGFIWDDDRYVTENYLLTAPDGLRRIWFSLDAPSQYFPLTYTTFRVERSLWGLNPTGYHWVNLLLHTANALLLWRLLARLKIPGAWLAAGIFALHPVQVESVAWIAERKNVLMGFFFLLTLLSWTAFMDAQWPRRAFYYTSALVFYALALSAKTTACTLPAALLLILWLEKKPIDRRAVAQIVSFLLLALGMGLLAVWWEKYHQGTRMLPALAPLERLFVASHAIWFYLGKLLWPAKLTFIYPQWKIDIRGPLAYMWPLATVALVSGIFCVRRFVGRSLEVAALFFVATLSPLLGFIMLYTFRYTFVADHYLYLASIGPIALAAGSFVALAESIKGSRNLIIAGSVMILASLALLTNRQSATFRDSETLWRTTLARNPACWMAYNNLGVLELEKGNVDKAIASCERSISLYQEQPEAHYNLASALLQKGRPNEAIAQCRIALQLQPNDPDAHVILGNALIYKSDVAQAILQYSEAIAIRPDDVDAEYNLGVTLEQSGHLDEAMPHLEKAVQLKPALAEAQLRLGNAYRERGREREALIHYQQALKASPNFENAQLALASLLATADDASLRDGAKAVQLAEAITHSVGNKDAYAWQVLATAYAAVRQFDKAVESGEEALKLMEDSGDAAQANEIRRQIDLYRHGAAFQPP